MPSRACWQFSSQKNGMSFLVFLVKGWILPAKLAMNRLMYARRP